MAELTSRERMLRTLRHQAVDYVPCCFMSFTALRHRCQEDFYKLVEAERAMGLDSFLFVPSAPRPRRLDHPDLRGLPVHLDPAVQTREWREQPDGEPSILHKEYLTPAGRLSTCVRLSEDWPHGEHIPFVDDYQVSRALKPLVSTPADLASLRYLLIPPSPQDTAEFEREARQARAFAGEHGVLLVGGWGVGADMANWLCGMENLIVLAHDSPALVVELLEMIHVWNQQRMAVVLKAPVDLYIYRAWYEGCDFLRPAFFREVMLPRLKASVELAHRHGALFGYIASSGTVPLLDYYLEAGIDALIGVDPVQGTYTDMRLMKRRIGDRIALWGGLSGAVTVEMGNPEDVRAAVREALDALGPEGFVLSPVDNITVDAPRTWQNIEVLSDEWRRLRAARSV